jgi:hypothetical protein
MSQVKIRQAAERDDESLSGDSSIPIKDQNEFEIGGMVSIWIGNFLNDVQFDDYMNLSAKFEEDFGFRLNDRSVQ